MIALPVSTTFAAVLALMLVWLTVRTIRARLKHGASMGDMGQPKLQAAIRSHGNYTENAPLALGLIALLEYGGAPMMVTAGLAGVFIVARILHPIGMDIEKAPNGPRVGGVMGTMAVFVVGALYALYMAWS